MLKIDVVNKPIPAEQRNKAKAKQEKVKLRLQEKIEDIDDVVDLLIKAGKKIHQLEQRIAKLENSK
jgi:BMFP domain-containing protein YqiC